MEIQFKNEKFQTEIRKKHRQRIITDIRRDLYHEEQINNSLQIHASQTLEAFLQEPTSMIPIEIVKHFETISFDLKTFTNIIETQLDPFNLVNVIFAIKCVHHYQIYLDTFCDKILDLSIQEFMHFDIIEIEGFFVGLKCSEEILLEFFCEYIGNMPEKEIFGMERIDKIKDFFVHYWKSRINNKELNFALSAKIISMLVKFYTGIQDFSAFVKEAIVVLIDEDKSLETYILVKRAIDSNFNLDLAIFVLYNDRLREFLYCGLDNELVFREVLAIIEIIIDNSAFNQKLNLDYVHIMEIMHSKYLSTHSTRFECELLIGFYIIADSELSGLKHFFNKIDYEEMLMKLHKVNLYDFLDLCLVILYNFPSEDTIGKIVFGDKMKIVEVIDRFVSNEINEKSLDTATKLSIVIERWVENEVEVSHLRNIIDDIIKIMENVVFCARRQEKTNDEKEISKIIDSLQELQRKLTVND